MVSWVGVDRLCRVCVVCVCESLSLIQFASLCAAPCCQLLTGDTAAYHRKAIQTPLSPPPRFDCHSHSLSHSTSDFLSFPFLSFHFLSLFSFSKSLSSSLVLSFPVIIFPFLSIPFSPSHLSSHHFLHSLSLSVSLSLSLYPLPPSLSLSLSLSLQEETVTPYHWLTFFNTKLFSRSINHLPCTTQFCSI